MKKIIFTVVFASAFVGRFALKCDNTNCYYNKCKSHAKTKNAPLCDDVKFGDGAKCSNDTMFCRSTAYRNGSPPTPCQLVNSCGEKCQPETTDTMLVSCCLKDYCNRKLKTQTDKMDSKSSAIFINVTVVLVFVSFAATLSSE
ncbi:hypothetical protein LSAT2_012637 [Lamellibrachia satsuma]|nr:hypothetical protein LSAT2_012637 [Lamellibrachia satsuma]